MARSSLPRRFAATAGIAGVIALSGSALPAAAAPAAPPNNAPVVVAAEGESSSISDNIGRLGLAGLTGMFGLLGYRKYKVHRATPPNGDPGRR
jgi:hypothetical protein